MLSRCGNCPYPAQSGAPGGAANRLAVAYAGTGTINTSDANEKTAPIAISDALLYVADDISIDAWRWLDAIAKNGEDGGY